MGKANDEYLATINRLEPDITPIDVTAAAASIAISLRRIADELAENNRIFRIVAQSHERANDKARREGSD